MQLFYTDHIIDGMAMLPEDESQHIAKVLRMRNGDKLLVTDGRGSVYEGTIYEAAAREVRVNLELIERREKDTPDLVIAIAPTKNRDRTEWFIEKAVEFGITEIYPIWCERSERKNARTDRWDRIAIAAMKQSLHLYKPIIHAPITFDELLNNESAEDNFIAWLGEEEESTPFGACYRPDQRAIIAIGPEGDFTPDEASRAFARNWKPVSLGNYRLRTETAGIAAASWANLLHSMQAER
jgi:16S rRNA (uracil1498-N3)-methyltransferase